MDDDAPRAALTASDVLPSGVRRRWSRRDALLPAVLTGELLAGVVLGMAWEVASSVPAPAGVQVSAVSTSSTMVVVPVPVVAPVTPPPPVPRTEARNPFAVRLG